MTVRLDLEQLLADTWSPQLRDAILERVEQSSPALPGYLVRAARDPALDAVHLMLLEDLAVAVWEELGVDLPEARKVRTQEVESELHAALLERWRDGGTLASIDPADATRAEQLLEELSPKAAEWAGCDPVTDPPTPLRVDGTLRLSTVGLERYLEHFTGYGVAPDERRAIRSLLELARPATGR